MTTFEDGPLRDYLPKGIVDGALTLLKFDRFQGVSDLQATLADRLRNAGVEVFDVALGTYGQYAVSRREGRERVRVQDLVQAGRTAVVIVNYVECPKMLDYLSSLSVVYSRIKGKIVIHTTKDRDACVTRSLAKLPPEVTAFDVLLSDGLGI